MVQCSFDTLEMNRYSPIVLMPIYWMDVFVSSETWQLELENSGRKIPLNVDFCIKVTTKHRVRTFCDDNCSVYLLEALISLHSNSGWLTNW